MAGGGDMHADQLPDSIGFHDNLLTIDAHPNQDIVASGTMDGNVSLYSYSSGASCHLISSTLPAGESSCRAVRFSKAGQNIYAVYKNKKFVAMDSGLCQVLHCSASAHSGPINSLCSVSQRLLATGDEDGCVKVWDSRLWKPVFTVHEHTDFISDMAGVMDKNTLLCSSGDGSLSAIDLRQRKLEERSDCCESELLSLATVKGGSKVVSGDGEGVLGIYTWGLWGDTTDRFPCHPQSVDSCVQTSDSVVCTGCADGAIRAIQILPNKLITVVGQHSTDYPVDNLCLSHGGEYLVSGSYDRVSFWPAEEIPKLKLTDKETDSSASSDEGEGRRKKRKRRRKCRKILKQTANPKKLKQKTDFFADL